MERSRVANVSRNVIFATLSQIVTVLLNLASRAVFVRVLAAEYMGLSGLFTNILGFLALAELGVGSAITYSLYKPIKDNDKEKIKSLMQLYRIAYWIIGAFIMIVGLILTPFIDHFIKQRPEIAHLEFIFILFILQSSITYFYSYKIQFLTADQNDYIVQKFKIIFVSIQIVLQILYLYLFKEYIGYLIIGIVALFVNNLVVSRFVDKEYPYLKEKASPLTKDDLLPIKKNVFALFLYRIAQRLSATIDTLIVSKFLGILDVAIYFNYHYLLNFADLFFTQILGVITPSLGNLLVTDDNTNKTKVFGTLQFIYYWLGTYMGVGFIVLFNTFIEIWLGKDYLFTEDIVVALAISSTVTNFQRPCSMMRDAGGLFWYGKLRPVASAIINIIASVILVKYMGIFGIIIGTILSKVLTFTWYDPYIVYKYAIKDSLMRYFIKYLVHWTIFAFLAYICYYLFMLTGSSGTMAGFLIGFVLVTIIVNGFFILTYYKSYDFQYVKDVLIVKFLKK